MAAATNKTEYIEYIKRRLGAPVVNIELSQDQIEDAIDSAIEFYKRNHFDGSDQVYLPVLIDATVKANRYIDLDESFIGVTSIFDLGSSSGSNILSADFILTADAVWQSFRSGGMVNYFLMSSYRSMIQELTVGKVPLRFNYNNGRVYIDMSGGKFSEGQMLMLDCIKAIDETTTTRIWKDPWLSDYAMNKVKKVWGQTLKKYQQVALPGGIMLDGQTLYNEADEKLAQMEEKVISDWQLPVSMMVG